MGEQQTNAQLASWLRVQSQLAADNGHDETAEALERAAQRLEGEISEAKREAIAKAIWAKRPDCAGKPWPLTDEASRRAYPHNPIAAVDLCFTYADAALSAARET